MSTKQQKCVDRIWSDRGYVSGVVFELQGDVQAYSFLYSSYQWAELSKEGVLKIRFLHHEAVVKGSKLEHVLKGLAEQKVSAIRLLPRSQLVGLVDGDEPLVSEISIRELEG